MFCFIFIGCFTLNDSIIIDVEICGYRGHLYHFYFLIMQLLIARQLLKMFKVHRFQVIYFQIFSFEKQKKFSFCNLSKDRKSFKSKNISMLTQNPGYVRIRESRCFLLSYYILTFCHVSKGSLVLFRVIYFSVSLFLSDFKSKNCNLMYFNLRYQSVKRYYYYYHIFFL